jgi:hypothetical protein
VVDFLSDERRSALIVVVAIVFVLIVILDRLALRRDWLRWRRFSHRARRLGVRVAGVSHGAFPSSV